MCGIIGQLSKTNKVNQGLFDSMRDTLAHRGPDGYGTQLLHDGYVAFGHRRLAILDLTDDGNQPMSNSSGDLWVTFNGEIYNYPDLKNILLEEGYSFKSKSDTEVLLHGYKCWGIEGLLKRLKGMFAFALWDEREGKLLAARDRFGIKPFVYYCNEKQFVFASEIKAIKKNSELNLELNEESLADYFSYGYVPYPNTIWKSTFKLPPASYLEVDFQTFNLDVRTYWTLQSSDNIVNRKEAVERTQQLIQNATKEHLLSDVPVGVFLSGGYDSSTLLMHMHDLGYPTKAFTIGFPESESSEHIEAAVVARHFHAEHYIENISSENDVLSLLQEMSFYYDEPFAANSMINTYVISRLASKHVKVALSGEGADEVFAGYKWHKKIDKYYTEFTIKERIKNLIKGNYSSKSVYMELYNRSMTGVMNEALELDLLSDNLRDQIRKRRLWHFEEFYIETRDKLKLTQFIDAKTFVPDHCLFRADISSMAHSLEVRVPFLDHDIYEYVFSLHPSVYFENNRKKILIEDNLKNRMPREVLDMPKRGFSFQNTDKIFDERFMRIMEEGILMKQGVLKRQADFRKLSTQMKFHLLNLEFWFERYSN